jgi:hypothetical protein
VGIPIGKPRDWRLAYSLLIEYVAFLDDLTRTLPIKHRNFWGLVLADAAALAIDRRLGVPSGPPQRVQHPASATGRRFNRGTSTGQLPPSWHRTVV